MKLKLPDLFSLKKKESLEKAAPDRPETAVQSETQGKDTLLKENYRKTMRVATEINRLRSRLPEIMKNSDPGQLHTVDEKLERIERQLNSPKDAVADLQNKDDLALEVIRNLNCLLENPKYETECDEGLIWLQEALTVDWFQADGMIRLERKLALLIALEGMIKAEIDELRLATEINAADEKMRVLLKEYEVRPEDHVLGAEILSLKNKMVRLKNKLNDTRTCQLEESNLLDLMRSALKKMPNYGNTAFAEIYENVEQENAKELEQAIERVKKIREKLIEDKVKLENASEEMEREGIVLTARDLKDIEEELNQRASVVEKEKAIDTQEKDQLIV